jgi:NTE family protein
MRPPAFPTRARLVAALLALAGCQTSQIVTNAPLPHAEGQAPLYGGGYRLASMINNPQGDVLAIMAFSGGGKRSSAFAHGALRGAAKFMIAENGGARSLLDDVDMISGVSGGSFPAMHYGLYHAKSFDTFPQDFLYRDINSYIFGMYLLPWNWEWLVTPFYGTNDRMAEIYDDLMFHGATYGDLLHKGLPFISVNATDIAGGVPFAFTQTNFDMICSDLSTMPVARAVAAATGSRCFSRRLRCFPIARDAAAHGRRKRPIRPGRRAGICPAGPNWHASPPATWIRSAPVTCT